MTTVIIGGGWSGLTAAVTLSQHSHPVQLLESSPQLGGRARSIQWHGITVDNGQHLMIGAYQQMLELFQLIGINENNIFNRLPMDLTIHDSTFSPLQLSAQGSLPWPLSIAWTLFRSAGLSAVIELYRVQQQISSILDKNIDLSVSDWLRSTKQSARMIQQFWEPLCLATLNTPINEASAQLLAAVLNDSLGQGKQAADLLIPKQPLGKLFPEPAANYIKQHGSKIELKTRVVQLNIIDNQVNSVTTSDQNEIACRNIIVATGPSHTVKLLQPHITLSEPQEYPICTIYLQYSNTLRLGQAMFGMTGTISQWIFDRSEQHPGMMAVVISGPGLHMDMNNADLISQVCVEVHQLFPHLPSEVEDSLVIREKRATFASTIGIQSQRIQHKTQINGLWLAGDYCDTGYPATLEGAILSGKKCASQLLESLTPV